MNTYTEPQKKFIASSAQLHRYLTDFLKSGVEWNEEDDINVHCHKTGNLIFGTYAEDGIFNVETTGQWEAETTYQQLDRLNDILKLIQDQPITISLETHGWITLSTILL